MNSSYSSSAIFETNIENLDLIARGKVRDIYRIDDQHMLIVSTDRLSAFDVVFPQPIPQKGELLTRISNFWFSRTSEIVENHLSKLKLSGIQLPAGLQQAEQLSEPIFTPSTKASVGDHDINVSFGHMVDLIGKEKASQVREIAIQLYKTAAHYALSRGIIIADTKFEFGIDDNDQLVLIDEILTPDSSRFWPADQYRVGISPPSFDKQFIRDYLETLDWDKTPPAPQIPQDIIDKTQLKYQQAHDILVGIGS
jgi:phosphoribosylaminoimidazole-succinocarboxamide synthase